MQYLGLKKDDTSHCFYGHGVTFFCQGDSKHRNKQNGKPLPTDIKSQIINSLDEIEEEKSFSVAGGEPFCKDNIDLVERLIFSAKTVFPDCKIYVYTNYNFKDLKKKSKKEEQINEILNETDFLITNPLEKKKIDYSLNILASKNQKLFKKGIFNKFFFDKFTNF